MKYRKKPVVIEAMRLGYDDWPEWFADRVSSNTIVTHEEADPEWEARYQIGATIKTLEGDMKAHPGDWIILGVNGEVYPCRPDIFQATYEPVE